MHLSKRPLYYAALCTCSASLTSSARFSFLRLAAATDSCTAEPGSPLKPRSRACSLPPPFQLRARRKQRKQVVRRYLPSSLYVSLTMRRFTAWYSGLLDRRPVPTKVVTAGLLAATGDFLAQRVTHHLAAAAAEGEEKNGQQRDKDTSFSHDTVRSLRMASASASLTPFAHYWYVFLGARFPGRPLTCMLLDQLAFAPVGGLAYLTIVGTLEARGDLAGGVEKVASCYVPVMQGNYAVWPAVMLANFKFVPVKYQVLVVNVVGLGWAVFASLVANAKRGGGGGKKGGEDAAAVAAPPVALQ